jgi:hypothetical protein
MMQEKWRKLGKLFLKTMGVMVFTHFEAGLMMFGMFRDV